MFRKKEPVKISQKMSCSELSLAREKVFFSMKSGDFIFEVLKIFLGRLLLKGKGLAERF